MERMAVGEMGVAGSCKMSLDHHSLIDGSHHHMLKRSEGGLPSRSMAHWKISGVWAFILGYLSRLNGVDPLQI
ncbi:hypothetical protein [Bhargavaea cecembensis]|uniref:hypothetical protein n=1 Tax=Bhargavaea cecembensis TaxID=394098 RepID=UPI0012E7203F|nr:hypothetical protein [Bhargavaea cecembensis]